MDTEKQVHDLAQRSEPVGDLPAASVPYDLFFAAQPTAMAVSRESDGLMIAVNGAWCALTGITAAQAIGRTSVALGIWADSHDRGRFLRQMDDATRLYPIRSPQGVERLVQLRTSKVRHLGESYLLVSWTEIDIGVVQHVTDALQLTLDSMSQGLAKIESDGRVSFYNRRLLEMLNLPETLMATHPTHAEVSAFLARRGDFGEDYELVDMIARDYVARQGETLAPERYLRRTPEGRVLEMGTRMLGDGSAVRTITDVTSYILAQESLSAERQRLSWILEATRPGIWELNLKTGELKVNERWAEIAGYGLEELQPIHNSVWEALAHPDDLRRAYAIRDRHIAGELPYYECDMRMRCKQGGWVWVNTRGQVHRRDGDGQALFMSGTHIDITERVAAQEEVRALNASLEHRVHERTAALERSMRDMEAVSYSIAHDLRAPLRAVNGFAVVISEEEAERLSPDGRVMFERITKASRNMGQMLTDMLEVLRVVRVEPQAEWVDMHALSLEIAEDLLHESRHARIQVDALPPAMGDAVLLRQVLSNLLDNALKYSARQPQPEIHVGHDAARKAYFVRDNGMGFDMAYAGKLFGLFQRLNHEADVPGLGVGLAIVSRIIERHNGRIWAESVPGQGATFWFEIPSPGHGAG